jgi:acyl carrier protein
MENESKLMERTEIIGKLNDIFEDLFEEGPVCLSDTSILSDVPGWDSFANVLMIVAVERYFNIRFTSEEIQSWKNIGEMVDCILTR